MDLGDFGVAGYTGLSSVVAMILLNILNTSQWKSKYDNEVETSKSLRKRIDDLIARQEEDLKTNQRRIESLVSELERLRSDRKPKQE
jgi:hypothetical protein